MTPDTKASDVQAREREAAWQYWLRNDIPHSPDTLAFDVFFAGYLARARQQPSAQWIACSEQLPPLDLPVLVMSATWPGSMFAAMRVDGGEGWLWAVASGYHKRLNAADEYEVDDDYEFSHWLPLPQSPDQRSGS